MAKNVHLLILIHGMWGNPIHMAEMHRIFTEKHVEVEREGNSSLEIHLAQTNRDKSTYDGIDWGGERIADEVCNSASCCLCLTDVVLQVYEKIQEIERDGDRKVTHFSIIGYSLGGLLARYVIGYVVMLSCYK